MSLYSQSIFNENTLDASSINVTDANIQDLTVQPGSTDGQVMQILNVSGSQTIFTANTSTGNITLPQLTPSQLVATDASSNLISVPDEYITAPAGLTSGYHIVATGTDTIADSAIITESGGVLNINGEVNITNGSTPLMDVNYSAGSGITTIRDLLVKGNSDGAVFNVYSSSTGNVLTTNTSLNTTTMTNVDVNQNLLVYGTNSLTKLTVQNNSGSEIWNTDSYTPQNTTGANIIPLTTNTYNIGSSSYYFNSAYINNIHNSTGVYISAPASLTSGSVVVATGASTVANASGYTNGTHIIATGTGSIGNSSSMTESSGNITITPVSDGNCLTITNASNTTTAFQINTTNNPYYPTISFGGNLLPTVAGGLVIGSSTAKLSAIYSNNFRGGSVTIQPATDQQIISCLTAGGTQIFSINSSTSLVNSYINMLIGGTSGTSSTSSFQVQTSTGAVAFGVDNSTPAINIGTNIIPSSNGTYNLGSSSYYFNNAYINTLSTSSGYWLKAPSALTSGDVVVASGSGTVANASGYTSGNVMVASGAGAIGSASGYTSGNIMKASGTGAITTCTSATTDTELGYVHGVTSAIQTQLNGKQASLSGLTSGAYMIATGTGSIGNSASMTESSGNITIKPTSDGQVFTVDNHAGNSCLNVNTSTGETTVQSQTNSALAFQVLNSSGSTAFYVGTSSQTVETLNNTLDDGSGNVTVGGNLTMPSSAPTVTINGTTGGLTITGSNNGGTNAILNLKNTASGYGSSLYLYHQNGDYGRINIGAAGQLMLYANNSTAGVQLASGATSWTTFSSKKLKVNTDENIDHEKNIDKLGTIPVNRWYYNFDDKKNENIGPYAEDLKEMFNVGNGESITTQDLDGVLYSCLKGLYQKHVKLMAIVEDQEEQIKDLRLKIGHLYTQNMKSKDIKNGERRINKT